MVTKGDFIMSITPNPPADFDPQRQPQIELTPFRFWCQKVLPLVYDDSLSYYELLCKVVDYLNKTMEDVSNMSTDMDNIYKAYSELQSYVNNYFSSLDVQEEIDNKLDEMASDGTLYEIIRKYTDPIVNEQNEKIEVLEGRMNAFTSLPNGSTTGDAELQDIRVGYNGTVYPNAGDAVREQISELHGYGNVMTDTVISSENYQTLLPDLNNAPINRVLNIVGVLNNIKNIPPNPNVNSATLFTINGDSLRQTNDNKSFTIQFLMTSVYTYFRTNYNNNYSEWSILPNTSNTNIIRSNRYTIDESTSLPNLNNVEVNTIYSINGVLQELSNIPENITENSGVLLTFSGNDNPNKSFQTQFLITNNSNMTMYSRSCWNGNWQPWSKNINNNDRPILPYGINVSSSNYNNIITDFDSAEVNVIYDFLECLNLINNSPVNSGSGTLLTYRGHELSNKSWCVQFFVPRTNTFTMYCRSCWGGNWQEWYNISTESKYVYEPINSLSEYCVSTCINKHDITLNSNTNILAFGDSITAGGSFGESWVTKLSNIIGCANVNKAVSGALFGHTTRESNYWISTQIDNTSTEQWNSADIIIVAAGTNDVGYNTPLSDLKTEVQNAITSIKNKNSTAPILFITPIRRGATDSSDTLINIPLVAGIIENVALSNECSVLNGFDLPIPSYTNGEIDGMMDENIHPNNTGMYVYAIGVINAIL